MKHAALFGLLVLAGGIPLESQALTFTSGPVMGMHNPTLMTGLVNGSGAFAANPGTGRNVSATAVGMGAGSASVTGGGSSASLTAAGNDFGTGNFSITLPNINFPAFTGFTLPEITIPDIGISGFPKITIPPSSSAGGNELQQSGTGNVANQVNNHSTSIIQQGSGAGTSTVIVNNADQNQLRQNSVP